MYVRFRCGEPACSFEPATMPTAGQEFPRCRICFKEGRGAIDLIVADDQANTVPDPPPGAKPPR